MAVISRFLADTTTSPEAGDTGEQKSECGTFPRGQHRGRCNAGTNSGALTGSIKLIQSVMSLVDMDSVCLILQRTSMSPFNWYKVKQNFKKNAPTMPGPQ